MLNGRFSDMVKLCATVCLLLAVFFIDSVATEKARVDHLARDHTSTMPMYPVRSPTNINTDFTKLYEPEGRILQDLLRLFCTMARKAGHDLPNCCIQRTWTTTDLPPERKK